MNLNRIGGTIAAAVSLLTLTWLPQAATAQSLEGGGSTFVGPCFLREFARYKQEKGVSINYQVIGSGAGYNAFKNKTVDFGASDAPMTTAEQGSLSGPAVQFPVVGGTIVMTYNIPGVGPGLRFTPEIIAGIFLGKIRTWDDPMIKAVNAGIKLPALTIQPVHRTDGSGTTYVFTNYLRKANGEWASGPGAGKSVNWPVGLGGNGNGGVAAVVGRTQGAVGYNELAYAVEHKLNYGPVKNRAGKFVNASVESAAAAINQYASELNKNVRTAVVDAPGADSYPITGLVYVFVYKTGPKAGELVKLFSWFLAPTQQEDVKTLLYVPLPASLIKINLETLKMVR